MADHREVHEVSYSPREMFDLVMDVERYPEFVPGWQAARILQTSSDTLRVQQSMGLGGLRIRFQSVATFVPARCVNIRALDGPFDCLETHWRFRPLPQGGCRINFRMRYALHTGLLATLAGPWLERVNGEVAGAFMRRAEQIYRHG